MKKFLMLFGAISTLAIAASPAIAGDTAGKKPAKDAWKAAKAVGKPQSCLSLSQIKSTRVRDDRTIDFYVNGGKVMRNTLPSSCPQLGFEEKFTYATSQSKLCSVDIITVLVPPGLSRGASCGLGEFQEVTGAPR